MKPQASFLLLFLSLFLFLLLTPLSFAKPKSSNILSLGSSLSVKHAASEILISPNKVFSCGFYTYGTDEFWFSIWFTNSRDRTVVWMANRDQPMSGHSSKVTLSNDGSLVLTDHDGSKTWEADTSLSASSSNVVDRVELLDSGNLVVLDPFGKFIWQSFDFPTHTLLPNQNLTRSTKLVSNLSPQLFSPGYFSLFFDTNNVLNMVHDSPEVSSIYWPDTDSSVFQNRRATYNSSTVAVLDDMGTFVSSDNLYFKASDTGIKTITRRLTIDHDGNLRLYSLNDSSGLWSITWQALAEHCKVHGLCGMNAICVSTPKPTCSCPPYYEPASSTDWSKGCKPKVDITSWLNESTFIQLTHATYPEYDLNFTEHASLEDCRQQCLGDHRCQAFEYGLYERGACFTKAALFNGYRSIDYPNTFYLRIPRERSRQMIDPTAILTESHLVCGTGVPQRGFYENPKKTFKWVYLYLVISTIGGMEVIIFIVGWFFFFRKHGLLTSLEEGYTAVSSQFRTFGYSELKRATGNFTEVLGRGGFGVVYKGVLRDGRVVAVKKLEDAVQGEDGFWAEVSTIGRINHINLARMWGFCSQGKSRLLVYECEENGSLDKHLFACSDERSTTPVLRWKERFRIALGVAKGLAYLHHECLEWVIHCDIKPENILLDIDFEPKISDFGLAKLSQRVGHGSSKLTRIRGTKGYMAPEWISPLRLTAKVDVYSYGVVILEIVMGFRLFSLVEEEEEEEEEKQTMKLTSLTRLAQRKREKEEGLSWVEDFVDPRLEGKFSRKQAAIMIEVGLSCVENDRNKRPTMESVAQILTDCVDEI